MDQGRKLLLHQAEQLRIDAKLDDVLRLGGTRKLCIHNLVAIRAQPRPAIYANEKIGVAHPRNVKQRTLVNDIRPIRHCNGCLSDALVNSRIRIDHRDTLALIPEASEMLSLVFKALLFQQFLRRIRTRP